PHLELSALEVLFRLEIGRIQAQHPTPGIGGFSRVLELFLPKDRDLACELRSEQRVAAAQDPVLVQVHETTSVVRKLIVSFELIGDLRVAGRDLVQLLEIFYRARFISQTILAEPVPVAEQHPHERRIVNLFEGLTDDVAGRLEVPTVTRDIFELRERLFFCVRDQAASEELEGALSVFELREREA